LRTIFCFVEIGLLDADVLPVDVEFVSDKHGEMRFDTLADFGILAHDGNDAVSGNAQKCCGLVGGGRELLALGKNFGDGIKVQGDENASSSDGRDAEKTATIEERGLHRTSFNENAIQVEGDTCIASIVNPLCDFRNSNRIRPERPARSFDS
jgi:hypothetical protein